MRSQRKSIIPVVAFAVAIALSTTPGPVFAGAESNGATLWGTWYVSFDAAQGLDIPAVVTFHRDGTFVSSDGSDFGGPPFPVRSTPLRGVWRGTGPGAYEGVALWLSGDPPTGELRHITKGHLSVHFAEDFDHMFGEVVQAVFECSTPFTCPDPLTAEPDFTLPPLPFRGTRLRVDG